MISDKAFGQMTPFKSALYLKNKLEFIDEMLALHFEDVRPGLDFRGGIKAMDVTAIRDAGFTKEAEQKYLRELGEKNSD